MHLRLFTVKDSAPRRHLAFTLKMMREIKVNQLQIPTVGISGSQLRAVAF